MEDLPRTAIQEAEWLSQRLRISDEKTWPAPSKHPVADRVVPAVQENISSHPRWGGPATLTLLQCQEMLLPQFHWHPPVLARLMATHVHESPIWELNPGPLLH